MNKKVWLRMGLTLIILALLYLWMRPQQVEREYGSVIYSNEAGMIKSTTIHFKGQVVRGVLLFSKSTLNGTLTVDRDLTYKIKLKDNGGYYLGVMTAWGTDHQTRTTGVISAAKKLDRFWTTLTDLDKRYNLKSGEGNISGPASTLEEAKQVGKDILAAYRS
ncbi:hypothetical protein [Paenibacillus sp. P46E]|uniref:hypothetical protein n=1 Tax=Paenibacillus sp. P46E TaxID=1349436 RepID=UPI00093C44A7|nr:hypothetical protein [Paenibacillus sp. P46E]OKP98984.1 hypothetical protein A3849_07315 [Paenibacillus sp. P46E]